MSHKYGIGTFAANMFFSQQKISAKKKLCQTFPKKKIIIISLFCCVQRLLFNYIQWEEKLDGAISQYILKALHEGKKV